MMGQKIDFEDGPEQPEKKKTGSTGTGSRSPWKFVSEISLRSGGFA
jgi:hypothetical protein